MTTTRAAAALSILAGTAASTLPALAQDDLRGSTYTCSISAWVWQGDVSDDFMVSQNWYNCGLLNGPDSGLNVYFGPIDQYINGVFQGTFYPLQPAVLTQNFNSPSVKMLSNSDTGLTVAGATYTASGSIGEKSDNFAHGGTATLTLDNAVWSGSLALGSNGGNACLVFRGSSDVTGTLSFGSGGTICFVNDGTTQLDISSSSNAVSSSVTWENLAGSTLIMDGSDYFYSSGGRADVDDLLINRGGALIRKAGTGTAYIYFPYSGTGQIDVEEGGLSFTKSEIRSGTFNAAVADNASLVFNDSELNANTMNIDLAPDASMTFTTVTLGDAVNPVELINTGSGMITLNSIDGPGTLALDGDNTVSIGNSVVLDARIINRGVLQNSSGYFDGRSGTGTWTNAPGSVLRLSGNYPFYNSLADDDDDTVVNEAGATIHKVSSGTTSIYWPYDGSGNLDVDEGTLSFTGSRIMSETIIADVADSAVLEYTNGTAIESDRIDVNLDPGATLRLSNVSLENPGGAVELVNSGSGTIFFGGTTSGPAGLHIEGQHQIECGSNIVLDTTVENAGEVTFGGGYFDGRYGVGTWINMPGATTTITSSYPFYNSQGDNNDDLFTNEAGATLRKTGTGTSYLYWPYEGDGAIQVEEGVLRMAGIEIRDATIDAVIASGASLHLDNNELIGDGNGGDVGVHLSGEGELYLTALSGPAALELGGSGTLRANSSTTLDTTIRSIGEFTFDNGYFDGRYGTGTWINEPGSVLRLGGSYPFYNSLTADDDDLLINEDGASIIRDGNDSITYIYWPFINRGTVDIRRGTINVYDTDAATSLQLAETSVIMGSGRFDFPNAPAIYNRGALAPSPVDPAADTDGLVIDVPFIQNDDSAVFRTQIGSLAGMLTCTGVYDVGGTIDIGRFGDFEPDGSEEFVVISAEFVSGVFGDHFDNAVPLPGFDTAFDVRTGDLEYDVTYTTTEVIVSNVSIFVPPCNPADLAEPGGLLDLADITAFATAFFAGDEAADIAAPYGLLDLSDINAFVGFFLGGCP